MSVWSTLAPFLFGRLKPSVLVSLQIHFKNKKKWHYDCYNSPTRIYSTFLEFTFSRITTICFHITTSGFIIDVLQKNDSDCIKKH